MKKFGEIYKEKLNEAETRQENKVLDEFKLVYGAMLEHYGLTSVKQLDDESQISFLTELNHYWSEEEGLNEKGKSFLTKRSMSLNENSTAVQKKNFLREKSYAVINETLRQSNLRVRLYDVIDEMYKQLKASDLSDILTPDMITSIITESLVRSVNEFTTSINKELKESVKPKRKYFVKVHAK
jgi:predicted nucleic-acid-binding protein